MTEFEEFQQFFDKYGIDYGAGDWIGTDDKGKSYIQFAEGSLEFEDGIFTHIATTESDTIVERKK